MKLSIYSTDVLKFSLCDYNVSYILIRGNITIHGLDQATQVVFKYCARFIKCITKIDEAMMECIMLKTYTWSCRGII